MAKAKRKSTRKKTTERSTTTRSSSSDYVVENQVGHLLRRAHQRHCSIFGDTIEVKLTPMQFAALAMIEQCGSISQNHLGRLVAMDPATIQGVVGRLADRRLIVSNPDPDDRRRQLWTLTAGGKRLFAQLIPVAREISAETLAPLTSKERKDFLRLLNKIV